MDNIGGISY